MDTLTPLILDFLEWIAAGPRPHSEVIEVWRTSCPRLTVWEDAIDQGLVAVHRDQTELRVVLTEQGANFLHENGR